MDNQEIEKETPVTEEKPLEGTPVPVAPPTEVPEVPVKPENRFTKFLRRLGMAAIIFLVIFILGGLTTYFTLYRPQRQELSKTREELKTAEGRISELENRITSLSSLDVKNKEIQAELDQSKIHVAILSAQVDVITAQLDLAKDDTAAARLILTKTPETLKTLKSLVGSAGEKAMTEMQARLVLATGGLANKDIATKDLEALTLMLIQLENTFFTSP
jgi:hypothetical protein